MARFAQTLNVGGGAGGNAHSVIPPYHFMTIRTMADGDGSYAILLV